MKRKRTNSEGRAVQWHNVVLEEETMLNKSDPGGSENESVHTIQSAETAIVSDTSDTSDTCDVSDVKEYSPLSLSETSDSDATTGSSNISSIAGTTTIAVIVEEQVSWADGDTSSSNSTMEDTEIPKADRWQCARCGCKKNHPVFRYCEKCFQRRKEEALPRPQRRKRKRQRKHTRQPTSTSFSTSLCDLPSTSSSLPSSSQETVASISSISSADSGFLSQNSDSKVTPPSNIGNGNMCNGCGSEPINAAFFHLRFAHMWGCYACSKKAWKRHKRCPICNGQSQVIKLL